MRLWCLALCLTLISGLFQAFAMPLENLAKQTSLTVNTNAHSTCHEAQDSNHHKSCHITGHLCCLGFSALHSQTTQTLLRLNHMLNPVFQTLLLLELPNKQFKPPKPHIQI